ncbi:MAG TPA: hypothetical protein VJM12_12405 [Pyrinomonadaceae bacterium]|nr:hypothetical protein [Pyrinomonadaceae bacterium]
MAIKSCLFGRVTAIMLGLLALPTSIPAQTRAPDKKPATAKSDNKTKGKTEADPLALQRRTVAISLLTSLADEARSYQDQTLRARVQARAADALWDSDVEKARPLFRRAWESATTADKEAWRRFTEERERQSREAGGGRFVQAPPNLRSEVLRLAAKRDRDLAEEFIAQLREDTDRDANAPVANSENPVLPATADPENPPAEITQRLELARQLLEEGDIGRALQIADKGLNRVTTRGIFFLCALREKDQAAADQRFANMVTHAVADPSSDAVHVSVLSTYVFTPFLYIIVRGNGQNHSSQERERIEPPKISDDLRLGFLRGATQILLRPLPPPDQDRTIAGRRGLYFVIARLLPLYDLYAADLAPELRVQLASLASDVPEDLRTGRNRLLTRGLGTEDQTRDEGRESLERAERGATPAERDQWYARAAQLAAHKGDATARDLVDKIADSDLRQRARAYVDFILVSRALDRKDPQEAMRLLRAAEITNIQRVWALLEVARMLKKTDATQAIEVVNEAATVARRIGGSDVERARAMVGVATLMFEVDRGRVWEAVQEAVRAANSVGTFSGEDAQVSHRFSSGRGTSTTNMTVENFDLHRIFSSLATEDLYRSIEMARGFTADTPRAIATLAVARAVLQTKKEPTTRSEASEIRN